jgi:hypothetical protein
MLLLLGLTYLSGWELVLLGVILVALVLRRTEK